jgi:hypothetical protein
MANSIASASVLNLSGINGESQKIIFASHAKRDDHTTRAIDGKSLYRVMTPR